MSKPSPKLQRQVRIEVLRAQAALEREQLCIATRQLRSSLEPGHVVDGLKQQIVNSWSGLLGGGSSTGSWLRFLFSSGQRYPILLSSASALLGTVLGKKRWRFGAMAMAAWRLFGAYKSISQQRKQRYVQPKNQNSSRLIGPL